MRPRPHHLGELCPDEHDLQAAAPRFLRDQSAQAWHLASRYTLAELEAQYEHSRLVSDPVQSYSRLAGEVEARNVQARIKFTTEQRVQASPASTADRDVAQQLVAFGDAPDDESEPVLYQRSRGG
jgi:hypothetical protein